MADEVHVVFIPPSQGSALSNTEVLLCAECHPLRDGMQVSTVGPDLEARLFAVQKISPEGVAHMCKGHRHAACGHVYDQLHAQAGGITLTCTECQREYRQWVGDPSDERWAKIIAWLAENPLENDLCPDCR